MKLITAHRVLIAVGIAFFVFYALVQSRLYMTRGGGAAALLQVAASLAVVVGLVLYYRSLRTWGRR